MANNTTSGIVLIKQNILPSTTAAGGTFGATAQSHFEYSGTFTALTGGGPVTVTEPNVTANSTILITLKTVGGTVSPGSLYISTITVGTGFTVVNATGDTSVYNYRVFN